MGVPRTFRDFKRATKLRTVAQSHRSRRYLISAYLMRSRFDDLILSDLSPCNPTLIVGSHLTEPTINLLRMSTFRFFLHANLRHLGALSFKRRHFVDYYDLRTNEDFTFILIMQPHVKNANLRLPSEEKRLLEYQIRQTSLTE